MERTSMEAGERRPPNLYFDMTGEAFEFQTSAKAGDGLFRFRWTLDGGKRGPPGHVHDAETETFTIVAGVLRIWLDGAARDLQVGDSVSVAPGVCHRFLNPGEEAVVVDVSLDGPRQEDALVPFAWHLGGRREMKLRDLLVMIVHTTEVRATRAPYRAADAVMNGLGRFIRLFGVKPLPPAERWSI